MEKVVDQQEASFSFEELFFSRTDARGIILAGNSVFQRISQYGWDELIKKPHNIIRHPDMPKGVFFLLWDFLKKGKPIGAYVKNRAKDGRYYWVFAIATPIDGGYLSVRLKPSSDFFPVVQDAYKALLAYEKENKVTPKESMEHLLGVLKTLGFGSYDEFMSIAIRKEIAARNAALSRPVEKFLERFEELTDRATAIMKETASIFSCYEANQYVPMNLQIQSAQLGDEGKTIGVISSNFSIVSSEIQTEIDTFNRSAREVFDKIYEGQFLLCTARIQREVCELFRRESSGNDDNHTTEEMAVLEQQQLEYQTRANASLQTIVRNINTFQGDCSRMKRCAASLEVIRVMGKVDSARLINASDSLNGLIDELGTFQTTIAQSLSVIEKNNSSLRHDAEGVIASLGVMSVT